MLDDKRGSLLGRNCMLEVPGLRVRRERGGEMKLIINKKQRDDLFNCHPGVGFLAYNNGVGIVSLEFYIGRKDKQLRHIASGTPVEFEFYEEEK